MLLFLLVIRYVGAPSNWRPKLEHEPWKIFDPDKAACKWIIGGPDEADLLVRLHVERLLALRDRLVEALEDDGDEQVDEDE